jgi:hypothetical protein
MARFMDVSMIPFSLIPISLADYGAPKVLFMIVFCDVAVSFQRRLVGE